MFAQELARHLQRDGPFEARIRLQVGQPVDRRREPLEIPLQRLVHAPEILGEPVEHAGPLVQAAGPLQRLRSPERVLDELQKPRERLRGRSLDRVEGEDALEKLTLLRGHGVAQEQAVQPVGPGVLAFGGQPERAAGVFIRAPPDAGLPHPVGDQGKIGLLDREAPADGFELQQAQNLGCPEPAPLQLEGRGPRALEQQLAAPTAVGDAERDVAPGVDRRTEHRGYVRGTGGDVGRHDDDVGRAQPRDLFEHPQQLVVQDLDLPHGAVAAVDGDRAVVGRARRSGRIRFRVAQVQDVRLDPPQKRLPQRAPELLRPAGGLDSAQELQELAPHPPAGRQQAVAPLQVQQRAIGATIAFGHPADRTLGQDAAPVFAAGVEEEKVDLHQAGEAFERPQVSGGKV